MIGEFTASYDEQIITEIRNYVEEGGNSPWTKWDIAEYLYRKGWEIRRESQLAVLARDIGVALSRAKTTDAEGRTIKTFSSVREAELDSKGNKTQRHFWGHTESSPEEFREESLRRRHKQLLGTTRQFKNDRDNFNDRRSPEKQLSLSLDFERVLEEAEQDASYRPLPDDDEDDVNKFREGMCDTDPVSAPGTNGVI